MIPASLTEEAARFVADYEPGYEFTRWTEQNWFDAFRYALSMVALLRPGDFTTTQTVRLQPGSRQPLPGDCESFVGPNEPLRRVGFNNLGVMQGRPVCSSSFDGDYAPTSYSIDRTDPSSFYVQPPVPDDADASLRITCQYTPWPDNEDQFVDVPHRYRGPVLDFMLWYAFGFDTESVSSRDRAAAHFKAATDTLGVERQERDTLWKMRQQELNEGN